MGLKTWISVLKSSKMQRSSPKASANSLNHNNNSLIVLVQTICKEVQPKDKIFLNIIDTKKR